MKYNPKNIENRIATISLNSDIIGICMFYFMSLYYEFKAQFDATGSVTVFNYEKYYADKEFRKNMCESAANLFLSLTIKILSKTANEANRAGNVNNWIRGQACEPKFFEALREEITSNFELEDKYKKFVSDFKL